MPIGLNHMSIFSVLAFYFYAIILEPANGENMLRQVPLRPELPTPSHYTDCTIYSHIFSNADRSGPPGHICSDSIAFIMETQT